mmetsp:Transcript_21312/g.46544  ORF Transcript_21312/g.46544 Transcript_21312/m.46544 type:complete len:186 (+) Transcript_21312:162-719(+)
MKASATILTHSSSSAWLGRHRTGLSAEDLEYLAAHEAKSNKHYHNWLATKGREYDQQKQNDRRTKHEALQQFMEAENSLRDAERQVVNEWMKRKKVQREMTHLLKVEADSNWKIKTLKRTCELDDVKTWQQRREQDFNLRMSAVSAPTLQPRNKWQPMRASVPAGAVPIKLPCIKGAQPYLPSQS